VGTLLSSLRKHGLARTTRKLKRELYRHIFRLLRFKTVRTVYGPRMVAQFSDTTFVLSAWGTYGFVLSDLIRSQSEEFVFLDIGANQGLYSLVAALNPACAKVIAFEPVRKTYGLLCDNIRLNRCSHVAPINAAISDHDGPREISINASQSGTASLSHRLSHGVAETVSCISAAGFDRVVTEALQPMREGAARYPRFVVKIDTEGHEPTVLRQLKASAIWPEIDILFFEVDEQWFSGDEVITDLEKHGFTVSYRSPSAAVHYDVMMRRVPCLR
jgi:FkbM family methyltransferase